MTDRPYQTGLVLSGGGTCGSYEIGVWRALRETGWEKRIGAVSSSSVGALNALLFAQGDVDVPVSGGRTYGMGIQGRIGIYQGIVERVLR